MATCRPGLEPVLAAEISSLAGERVEVRKRAVRFETDKAGLYRMNMGLRSAIQVLMPIRSFNARDYRLLYFQARRTNWHHQFTAEKTLRIDVNGHSPNLRNTQYVVHRIKDGIVDTFRKMSGGIRPSIEKSKPQIHVVAHLDGNEVTLSLDSSGVPLFKRGYRLAHGEAPIKEDLAAGMLLLAEASGFQGIVDPMCGSGTFLFEGWMLANGVAPNLEREFAFQHWNDYDPELHLQERQTLVARRRREEVSCIGTEAHAATAEIARGIREKAFPEASIRIEQMPFQALKEHLPGHLVITNPPYGERMGSEADLTSLYRDLGHFAKRLSPGGRLAVFTANRKAARQIRLRQTGTCTLFNGSLEGVFYQYPLRGD